MRLSPKVRNVLAGLGAAMLVVGVGVIALPGSAAATTTSTSDTVACSTFASPDTVDNGGGVFKVLTNNINNNTPRGYNDFIRFNVVAAGYTIVSATATNHDGTIGVFSTSSGAQSGKSVAYNSPNGTYIVSAKVCASKPAPPVTTTTTPPTTTTTTVPPSTTTTTPPACNQTAAASYDGTQVTISGTQCEAGNASTYTILNKACNGDFNSGTCVPQAVFQSVPIPAGNYGEGTQYFLGAPSCGYYQFDFYLGPKQTTVTQAGTARIISGFIAKRADCVPTSTTTVPPTTTTTVPPTTTTTVPPTTTTTAPPVVTTTTTVPPVTTTQVVPPVTTTTPVTPTTTVSVPPTTTVITPTPTTPVNIGTPTATTRPTPSSRNALYPGQVQTGLGQSAEGAAQSGNTPAGHLALGFMLIVFGGILTGGSKGRELFAAIKGRG